MFGIDSSELFILAVLALIFIGPKELPSTMRTVGRLIGRVRAHTRHFTAGIENIMREAELQELEKRWREENVRVRTQFPLDPPDKSTPVETFLSEPAMTDPAAPFPPVAQASADEPQMPRCEPENSVRPLP